VSKGTKNTFDTSFFMPERNQTEWLKTKSAMFYIDMKDARAFKKLLNAGLRYVRLPNGEIRIKKSWVDEYLIGLERTGNDVDQIVSEVMKNL
jgi:hypothetical protein